MKKILYIHNEILVKFLTEKNFLLYKHNFCLKTNNLNETLNVNVVRDCCLISFSLCFCIEENVTNILFVFRATHKTLTKQRNKHLQP